MKKLLNVLSACAALMLVFAPHRVISQTNFFSDTFNNGSTVNSATPAYPGTNYTSYEVMSSKSWSPTPSIGSGNLKFGIASSTAGSVEIQALFTTNPVALVQVGDYVQMTIVFTNFSGMMETNFFLGVGMYNSGQVLPVAGGLNALALNSQTAAAIGGAQNWAGYVAQLAYTNSNSRIMTRTNQATGTDNRNQDLVTSGSSSQSYGNPPAATIGTAVQMINSAMTNGGVYTEVLTIAVNNTNSGPQANSLAITNQLYSGPDTTGTLISQVGAIATNAQFYASAFDSLAIGWTAKGTNSETVAGGTVMAISSINVSGISSPVQPPVIVTQPAPLQVVAGGSCAFTVTATAAGELTYQWHRNGTNLVNGGNISGATSGLLVISPAGAGDALSGVNGYYVTVANSAGSVNSTTNSLSLVASTNLTWNGSSGNNTWDINSSSPWLDGSGNVVTFNYGDPVVLDDGAVLKQLYMVGSYISPSSVTVNSQSGLTYTFQGPGSLAGPCSVTCTGNGELDIKNANSYTGGTILSNASAFLYLENYAGLGSGPLTFAVAGASMEITAAGSSSVGLTAPIVVNDNAAIQIDGTGSYATVFLGDLSGVAGKTLTLNPADLTTTNRIRFYGANTVYNGNLVLNGPAVSQAVYSGTVIAPYNNTGSQTYNGVISGNGGIIQRANGTTILNGLNTYSGGTTPTTGSIALGADSAGSAGPLGSGPLYLAPELPNTSGSGQVYAVGGAHTIANPILYPSGTNNQTLIIGGTNDITFTGPYWLNGLDGQGTATSRTLQVTNLGVTTLSGVIADTNNAGWGLTKTGNGKLVLTATETYTGPTLVSAGKLKVNGALNAGSAVTVTNGGFLGGSGTVNGAVTIATGGGLAPGENATATFTINNNLLISGGTTNVVKVDKGGSTHDLVVVSGNATYGGTLYVTNLSGTITTSDTFQIFSVTGTKGGSFTNILGSPGSGMAWTFTPSTGILGVVQSVNTTPTNIVFSVTGGNTLNLSWPADHTGWRLQVQTNTLGVGITTNGWVDVPNSTNINSTNFTINPQNGTVFYRMVYP